MDRTAPLAFVARPETVSSIPPDAALVPLRPEVRSTSLRHLVAKPEDLLLAADVQAIESGTERTIREWWQDLGADPFLWHGVNLAECFSGALDPAVRDLLKTNAIVDRSIEGREPASLVTDVPPVRHSFPPYPHLEGIGSLLETVAMEKGWTCRAISSAGGGGGQPRRGSSLASAYLGVASRKAMAVLRRERFVVAVGPHPDFFGPLASALGGRAQATVVLTTERFPVRASSRGGLYVVSAERFGDSSNREQIRRLVQRALGVLESMAPPSALGDLGPRIWGPLRVHLRARFELDFSDLAAIGVAFDDDLGRANHVVLLETESPFSKAVVRFARRRRIPILVIQHGILGGPSSYGRTEADEVAAWGPNDAGWFAKVLGPRVHVAVTGSPRYDQLATEPTKTSDRSLRHLRSGTTIITLASQPFVQDRADRSPWDRQAAIDMALRAASELKGFTLVIKWHPAETPSRRLSTRPSDGVIEVPSTANTFALIRRSSAVLAISSTVALEAMYLGRPVVFLGPPDPMSPFRPPEDGGGLRARNSEELIDGLRRMLHDATFREKTLERQRAFLERAYAPLDGRAADRVVALLRGGESPRGTTTPSILPRTGRTCGP